MQPLQHYASVVRQSQHLCRSGRLSQAEQSTGADWQKAGAFSQQLTAGVSEKNTDIWAFT
jgi:hypothetical protein